MNTAFCPLPRLRIQHLLIQTLIVGGISTASLLLGLVPSLQSPSPMLVFSNAAYAQAVTDQEVQDYAKSVLSIEPIRQSAYNKIKQIIGSANVPEIVCGKPDSLNALPANIRDIATDYCKQASTIVRTNHLSTERFNEITTAHRSDPELSNRIQQAMMRLQ